MKVTNRKMYRKDARAKQKHYALIFILFVAVCIIGGNYVKTAQSIDSVSASEVLVPQELSVRDYVLGEVRKANIDEFKVWALVNCESRWSPEATNVNYSNRLGVDRGIFQISDKFHPEVSNTCAYNYKCATREAIRIIKKYGFKEWSCGKILGL